MNRYIRPRQDFSLSRIAQAMRCLVCCDFEPTLHVWKDGKVPVMLIRVNGVGGSCEKAIATLIDMEHFNEHNFKIIELSPAEVLTEVD